MILLILEHVAGLSTQLGLLGTSDAVSDMNALANITSDISALAGALEQTYTVTVGGGNLYLEVVLTQQ